MARMGVHNFAAYLALTRISTNGPAHITQADLAEELGVSTRRTSQAIKWLCKNGYLLRYRDSSSRFKYSTVTDPDLLPVIQRPQFIA